MSSLAIRLAPCRGESDRGLVSAVARCSSCIRGLAPAQRARPTRDERRRSKRKGSGKRPEPPALDQKIRPLFELAREGGEAGVELRTESVHDGDNRDRDAGGDEAILDGGCARLVFHKALN